MASKYSYIFIKILSILTRNSHVKPWHSWVASHWFKRAAVTKLCKLCGWSRNSSSHSSEAWESEAEMLAGSFLHEEVRKRQTCPLLLPWSSDGCWIFLFSSVHGSVTVPVCTLISPLCKIICLIRGPSTPASPHLLNNYICSGPKSPNKVMLWVPGVKTAAFGFAGKWFNSRSSF